MKSNANATRIKNPTTSMLPPMCCRDGYTNRREAGLGVLERDTFHHVGDILAAVDGILEKLVNVFHLDDGERVLVLLEQARHRPAQQRVAGVLVAVDLHAYLEQRLAVLQIAQ